MPRAAFTTLGCKVNQYETQRILESFADAGFEVVPFDSAADVYVVNTCSVTAIAESKSRYTVRRALRANPSAKVVVTGCAGQMALNERRPFPEAHLVVPNPDKMRTLEHVLRAFPGLGHGLVPKPASRRGLGSAWKGRTRATVKIQDGCNIFCSYCSIPYTRPHMTSRPAAEVLSEVERLVEMGYKEVVLSGVLVGAYGPETGSGGPQFEDLIELMADTRGVERIRISSIEMGHVTYRLMNLMACGVVVPHLHLPLQSGSDGVLRDMNRPYTVERYLSLLDLVREVVPDLQVTTDVMVGFPTEDERRFEEGLGTVERAAFLKAHVFRFSPRPGTRADAWGDPVPPEEKQRRSRLMLELTAKTGEAQAARFLGRRLRVLVEGKCPQTGLMTGLADNYLEVRFAGPVDLVRRLCTVVALEVRDGVLYGELAADGRSSGGDGDLIRAAAL
ncbi:MAG: tRNA (N(6)-L-threonylcarbamoyladenosine(37)-C(2))-methylthiotransferase MtaB [Fimbriimonadales bacterium]|nr:tRNA (N(6)-L-threonylcarbamoyladenosine(37)-C(2))-methylthiotransferase MtaB [Fimbriimonadales bacterium]